MIMNILQCCKSRLKPTVCITNFLKQQRFFSMMKTSDAMGTLLKRSDHIPQSYVLVYRMKNTTMHNLMYHSTNLMVCVTFGVIIYFNYMKFRGMEDTFDEKYLDIFDPLQCSLIVLVNIAIITAAAILRQRMAIRIYKDTNRKIYKAIYHGKVPFHVEQYEFPEKSLSYIAKESSVPWKSSLFNIEGHKRKILLFDDMFRTYDDFYQMLRPDQLET